MTDKKKQDKVIKALKTDLNSNKKETILDAITKSREEGNATIIPDLINLLNTNPDSDIKNETFKLLNDLKTQSAVWPLVAAINNTDNRELKAQLIAVFWQSGLDIADYFDEFVKWAMDDDFFIANEAITVLESNNAISISEDDLMNYLYDISEIVNQLEDDNPRKNLLLSLAEILKTYPVE